MVAVLLFYDTDVFFIWRLIIFNTVKYLWIQFFFYRLEYRW